MSPLRTITAWQIKELRNQGLRLNLIDISSPDEFRRAHADLAENVPLIRLDPTRYVCACGPDQPLYVISRNDTQSRQACERLRGAGCEDVVQVEGGTEVWEMAGLPTIRDDEPHSPVRAWAAVALILTLLVLVGPHIHPIIAALLIVLLAAPLVSALAELFRSRSHGEPIPPRGRPLAR